MGCDSGSCDRISDSACTTKFNNSQCLELRGLSSIYRTVPLQGYESIHIEVQLYTVDLELQDGDKCGIYWRSGNSREWPGEKEVYGQGRQDQSFDIEPLYDNDKDFWIALDSVSNSLGDACWFDSLYIYGTPINVTNSSTEQSLISTTDDSYLNDTEEASVFPTKIPSLYPTESPTPIGRKRSSTTEMTSDMIIIAILAGVVWLCVISFIILVGYRYLKLKVIENQEEEKIEMRKLQQPSRIPSASSKISAYRSPPSLSFAMQKSPPSIASIPSMSAKSSFHKGSSISMQRRKRLYRDNGVIHEESDLDEYSEDPYGPHKGSVVIKVQSVKSPSYKGNIDHSHSHNQNEGDVHNMDINLSPLSDIELNDPFPDPSIDMDDNKDISSVENNFDVNSQMKYIESARNVFDVGTDGYMQEDEPSKESSYRDRHYKVTMTMTGSRQMRNTGSGRDHDIGLYARDHLYYTENRKESRSSDYIFQPRLDFPDNDNNLTSGIIMMEDSMSSSSQSHDRINKTTLTKTMLNDNDDSPFYVRKELAPEEDLIDDITTADVKVLVDDDY